MFLPQQKTKRIKLGRRKERKKVASQLQDLNKSLCSSGFFPIGFLPIFFSPHTQGLQDLLGSSPEHLARTRMPGWYPYQILDNMSIYFLLLFLIVLFKRVYHIAIAVKIGNTF